MRENLQPEIMELQLQYSGLTRVQELESGLVISGVLPFEASSEGRETITDLFEIDLIVPENYPKSLPWVLETSGRISNDYEHVYDNGKLCLAVPTEERMIFKSDPSLQGFVTKLLIPYCYGYCYWERYEIHPFGEREHGGEGIVCFYIDRIGLENEIQALDFVLHLVQHGYRGHHECPCGSGSKLRNCHGPALRAIHDVHTKETVQWDFLEIIDCFLEKMENKDLKIPNQFMRRISSQIGKMSEGLDSSKKHIKRKRREK